MPTLYVAEVGSRLELEHQRLLVTLEDEIIFRIPFERVDQIVLLGQVGMTTPVMHELLAREIPVILMTSRGKFVGSLAPATARNLPLRQAQYQHDGSTEFGLRFARSVVAGKIFNQWVLAGRWVRRHLKEDEAVIHTLWKYMEKANLAKNIKSLLGIEGSAASIYFGLMQKMVPEDWQFQNRNRRPPRDPVNAMLSLGYTLLTYTCLSALEVVGLDPYLGYYHTEAYGRPALALDLMEEFRAPLVDSLVISLIRRHEVDLADFHYDQDTGATYIECRSKRQFLKRWSHKLDSQVLLPEFGRRISYRKILEVQSRRLSKLVLGDVVEYIPFRNR